MSLIATARSVPGTLQQDVLIDGRHRLTTDEPERLGGDGTGPAPHELFPAALAACVSTTLVMYARTKEWDLGEVTVHVDYDHRATPRQNGDRCHRHGRSRPAAVGSAREGRCRLPAPAVARHRHRVRRALLAAAAATRSSSPSRAGLRVRTHRPEPRRGMASDGRRPRSTARRARAARRRAGHGRRAGHRRSPARCRARRARRPAVRTPRP